MTKPGGGRQKISGNGPQFHSVSCDNFLLCAEARPIPVQNKWDGLVQRVQWRRVCCVLTENWYQREKNCDFNCVILFWAVFWILFSHTWISCVFSLAMISVLDAEKTCWLGVNAEEDGAPPVPTIVVAPETFGITRAGLPSAPVGAAEAWAWKEEKYVHIYIQFDGLKHIGASGTWQQSFGKCLTI